MGHMKHSPEHTPIGRLELSIVNMFETNPAVVQRIKNISNRVELDKKHKAEYLVEEKKRTHLRGLAMRDARKAQEGLITDEVDDEMQV